MLTACSMKMAKDAAVLVKIRRYWFKKQLRCSEKRVRYNCRQNLAKQRYRHQGRFITREEMEKLDPELIYDPNVRYIPKIKQVFRISKEHHHSLSCRSAHSARSCHSSPNLAASDSSYMVLTNLGSISPASSARAAPTTHLLLESDLDLETKAKILESFALGESGTFLSQRMRLPSHQEQLKTTGLNLMCNPGQEASSTDITSLRSPNQARLCDLKSKFTKDSEMIQATPATDDILARFALGMASAASQVVKAAGSTLSTK